jgi:hypothetical protein
MKRKRNVSLSKTHRRHRWLLNDYYKIALFNGVMFAQDLWGEVSHSSIITRRQAFSYKCTTPINCIVMYRISISPWQVLQDV